MKRNAMPPMRRGAFLLAVALLANFDGASATGANPIRKVVNMLKMMQKKIEQEGDKKSKLFEKFMCYCKNTGSGLQKGIAAVEDRLPQIESQIKAVAAGHQQLTEDLKQHKKDREDANTAVATADALRAKESAAFSKDSADYQSNVGALGKAIAAVAKGTGAEGFLQANGVDTLKKLIAKIDMANSDRDLLATFLQGGTSYSPQSGEILGVLKQLKDDMEKDLAGIVADEESAVASHESLKSAKEKEVKASSKAIEEKTGRVGELAVQLVSLRQDKDDAEEGMAEDKKFLGELGESCEKKKKEWTDYQKNQAAEQMAIADTVKMLNDDDAQDLFKKTLQSPAAASAASFLQVASNSKKRGEAKHKAGKALRRARSHGRGGDVRVDLIALALRGKKKGFEEVLAKVHELMALLGQEQQTEDAKQDYCNSELDKADDEKRAQTRQVSDIQASIASAADSLKSVNAEIEELAASIKGLDAEVAEATASRKEEHAVFNEANAANNAAKDLLEMAKNRLAKFYNPALYKAPGKQELSGQDRIATNFGAEVQVASERQAPEADMSFQKKGEESGGVVAMLNLLKDDIEKDIQLSNFEEKEAQKDYEEFETNAGDKRKLDSSTIAEKESARAEIEATLHEQKDNLKSSQNQLMETGKEIFSLHADCDWFLANFDLRKEARANEVDALGKAEAVLHGANFS